MNTEWQVADWRPKAPLAPATSHGKEVKVHGVRWADATSAERAKVIVKALNHELLRR